MSDQATMQSPSIENRAASALFGEPQQKRIEQPPQFQQEPEQPEVSAEQQGEPQAPEFEEVEYDGERFQVPPKLKKGLMLNEDYTKKTQELAESRKAVEISQSQAKMLHEQQKFLDSVAADVDQIKLMDQYLRQPIDWQSLPVEELIRKRAELDQIQQRRNELHAEVGRKETEFKGSLRSQQEELQRKSREVLTRKIPGWNAEVEKDVKDWAISQGFTSEEVSAILNPVHAETLYKARQYDKLVANKTAAQQQASQAAPMGKPGSANAMPQAVKEKLSFQKALKSTTFGSQEQKQLVEKRLGSLFAKR